MRARWEDVARVVDQALDLELTGRPQFVERACSGDAVLRGEVDRLLDAAAGAGDYLDHPAADVAPLVLWVARQESQALATGTRFGVYEVTGLLGRGGMATVYLAEDQKHHRMVAVKVFDAEFGAAIGREWFLREIDIAAKLHHPHILPLHDSGEVDGRLYYVMPHVEGESLRQRLSREGRIPLVDARRIVQEVAGALDYAHRQGLVHRDIKPENILLQDGQAIVADFGIARAIVTGVGDDGAAETLPAIGTPAYMSPEQATGSTRVDATTDIYALGCVVYEMLSGQPPFLGPTPRAILAQHALDPVPPLRTLQPTVPLAFAQVVTQALAKVPSDRFPTARAFAEALAGASVALEASGDNPPSTVLEPRRAGGRRRGWILAAAAALAAAGLAAVLTRKPADVEPSRVLVLPFENRTGDSTLDVLGDVVADYVTRGLKVARYVREVVDGPSRAEGGRARNLTPTAARGLARDAGSGTIVLGSYDRTPGDSVQLQAEVLDTRTGRALRLIGPVSAPVEARLAALTGVRTRVMAAVSSLLDWDFSEETSLPETYEALEEWRAGSEAWMHCSVADCEAQGIAHMRRAAGIDSNFTLPLAALAFRFMGSNCPLVDSVAAELQPRLERLPAEDATQLSIATFLCHGDLPDALDRANDPANERMGGWKAMLLLYSNRPREVIPILAPLDESRARDPERNLPMLLDAYHRLGQYDSALAFVARMRRIKVNNNGDLRGLFLEEEAASLAGLGRVADVAMVMDRMVRQLADDQEALVHHLELTGLELAVHGHAAAAQQAFDRAITWLKAQSPDQQASPHARRGLAYLLNSAGRWDEALAIYRSVTAPDSNDFDGWATLGDLAARRGDRAEAERIERLLTAIARRGKKGAPGESWALYGRARIAGLLGERARAIGLLRQAAQMGFSEWREAHRDPDLAPLRDDPAFQDWIRPKD